MFLCLSLSISTHEGQFYWYTDKKAGPAFSQVFSTCRPSFFYSIFSKNVMSFSSQSWIAGIGRPNLRSRLSSITNWSSNLPQNPKRLKIPTNPLLRSTLLRRRRVSRRHLRTPVEFSLKNSRWVIRSHWRVCYSNRDANPMDADDGSEHSTMFRWNRRDILCIIGLYW